MAPSFFPSNQPPVTFLISQSFYAIGGQPGSTITLEDAGVPQTICTDMWWLNRAGTLSTDPTSRTLSHIVSGCDGTGNQLMQINYLDPLGRALQCAQAGATFEDGTGLLEILCLTNFQDIDTCFPIFFQAFTGKQLKELFSPQPVDLGFQLQLHPV